MAGFFSTNINGTNMAFSTNINGTSSIYQLQGSIGVFPKHPDPTSSRRWLWAPLRGREAQAIMHRRKLPGPYGKELELLELGGAAGSGWVVYQLTS